MIQEPKGKFIKVRCDCKNEQIIFGKAATEVKCLVCDKALATSTGGKTKLIARELEVMNGCGTKLMDDLVIQNKNVGFFA